MNYWMKHICANEVMDSLDVVKPMLEKVEPLYSDRMSTEYTIGGAVDGRFFFDLMMDENDKPCVLFIIELVEYPKTWVLRIMSASGDIGAQNLDDALLYADQYFTALARKNGFGFVEYEGRKGWSRKFKQLGVPIIDHELVIRAVGENHESSHEDSLADDGGPREVRAAGG